MIQTSVRSSRPARIVTDSRATVTSTRSETYTPMDSGAGRSRRRCPAHVIASNVTSASMRGSHRGAPAHAVVAPASAVSTGTNASSSPRVITRLRGTTEPEGSKLLARWEAGLIVTEA